MRAQAEREKRIMKLYIIPGAPNCRRAEAVVHHLGANIDIEALDPRSGALRRDDFLAINPNGLVPVLEDGDFMLWESHAIMLYLANLHEAADLYPADLKARADVDRWLAWSIAHFNRAVGAVVWEIVAKPFFGLGEADAEAVAKGKESFHRCAPILEARLAETGAFVHGQGVTLADYSLATFEAYWRAAGLPLDPYPAIRAWGTRLGEIEAWRKSAPPTARDSAA
jgi:glutathione S-transferase